MTVASCSCLRLASSSNVHSRLATLKQSHLHRAELGLVQRGKGSSKIRTVQSSSAIRSPSANGNFMCRKKKKKNLVAVTVKGRASNIVDHKCRLQ